MTSLNDDKNYDICHIPDENSFLPLWSLCGNAGRKKALEDKFNELQAAAEESLWAKNRFVTDIKFVSNKDASAAKRSCPEGYDVIDKDLNKGAGGNFIYLCYKLGAKKDALTNFCMEISGGGRKAEEHVETHQNKKSTYTRNGQDLNQGSRGDYIYFNTTKDSSFQPVSRVDVLHDNETLAKEWMPVHWVGTNDPADCNKSVRGSYVYIMYKRLD